MWYDVIWVLLELFSPIVEKKMFEDITIDWWGNLRVTNDWMKGTGHKGDFGIHVNWSAKNVEDGLIWMWTNEGIQFITHGLPFSVLPHMVAINFV